MTDKMAFEAYNTRFSENRTMLPKVVIMPVDLQYSAKIYCRL